MHITISGTAFLKQRQVDGYVVASCPELRIFLAAKSQDDLKEKMRGAMALLITHLTDHDILRPFLEARGFVVTETPIIFERDHPSQRLPSVISTDGLLYQYA